MEDPHVGVSTVRVAPHTIDASIQPRPQPNRTVSGCLRAQDCALHHRQNRAWRRERGADARNRAWFLREIVPRFYDIPLTEITRNRLVPSGLFAFSCWHARAASSALERLPERSLKYKTLKEGGERPAKARGLRLPCIYGIGALRPSCYRL
jgi:hypothetical protein